MNISGVTVKRSVAGLGQTEDHHPPLVSYLGDGASLDEGGLVCGLCGWNEWRRRGNVGRSTGSAERHADSILHTLDQLVGCRVEDWWKYENK